jgi:hypothetical protein
VESVTERGRVIPLILVTLQVMSFLSSDIWLIVICRLNLPDESVSLSLEKFQTPPEKASPWFPLVKFSQFSSRIFLVASIPASAIVEAENRSLACWLV